MPETRTQLKSRLKAAGVWKDFVDLREQLTVGGMAPPVAKDEALRQIEARIATSTGTPTSEAPADDAPKEPVVEQPGMAKEVECAYVASPDDGASAQLRDMRHVYNNGPMWDKTQGQKNQRAFLDKHPGQFNKVIAGLEEGLAATKVDSTDGTLKSFADGGSERVQSLIADCLAKIDADEAKENAELAARPNAAEIGASLQKSLARALEREKRLQERVKELERNAPHQR